MATFQAPPWWPSPPMTFLRLRMIGAPVSLAMPRSPLSDGDGVARQERGFP